MSVIKGGVNFNNFLTTLQGRFWVDGFGRGGWGWVGCGGSILDKRDQDEETREGKPTCSECESGNEDDKVDEEEFFNLDLSKTALEDLKLKAVGRRSFYFFI